MKYRCKNKVNFNDYQIHLMHLNFFDDFVGKMNTTSPQSNIDQMADKTVEVSVFSYLFGNVYL